MYTSIFYSKNNRKYLVIAIKYMEGGKNRISIIKNVEIADGKTDAIHSALSNEIEKCGRVESLNGFESDRASVIIGHKKFASKLKRDYPKTISIHNYQLKINYYF